MLDIFGGKLDKRSLYYDIHDLVMILMVGGSILISGCDFPRFLTLESWILCIIISL